MGFSRLPIGFLQHCVARFQSRETLERSQLKRFRRLLRYILPRSPYYRSVVKEGCIDLEVCRPEDFPVLTKSEVTDHFDEMITVRDVGKRAVQDFLSRSKDATELLQGRYFCLHTSGSSGTIGYCVFDRRDWYSGMAPALLHQPPPRGRRNRVAFVGAIQGHFAGVSITAVGEKFPLSLFYVTLLLDIHEVLSKNVEELNRFQPDLIVGYPAALVQLSEEQKAGRLKVRPRLIHSSGGILMEPDRKLISEVFGVKVINFYASSEHLLMAASDGSEAGLRLFEDYLYFEARSDHTLVTNLYNRTLPLIRYRMDDALEFSDQSQPSPHRFASEIIGRPEDSPTFINRDGNEDTISCIVLSTAFARTLRRFQIQVHNKSRFTFWAVLEEEGDGIEQEIAIADLKSFLDDVLRKKRMENVRYEVRLTDRIGPDPRTGKFRLVTTNPMPGTSSQD